MLIYFFVCVYIQLYVVDMLLYISIFKCCDQIKKILEVYNYYFFTITQKELTMTLTPNYIKENLLEIGVKAAVIILKGWIDNYLERLEMLKVKISSTTSNYFFLTRIQK